MKGVGSFAVLAILFPSILISFPFRGEAKVDPETGFIRVLFIGDALMAEGMPAPLLVQDPILLLTPIPAEIATIGGDPQEIQDRVRKFFRLYLPRTKASLWDDYDVVIIAATQADYPNLNFQTWLRDGVLEDGMGFLMADDPASFGGAEHGLSPNPSWANTPVGEILSVECAADRKDWGSFYYQVEVIKPDNPMVRGLDWEGMFLRAHNRVFEKPGSEIVMVTTAHPANSPVLAWINIGEGRSVSFVNDWGGKGITPFYRWPSAATALANMVYYAAQVPIPEDLELVRRIRDRMAYYSSLRAFAISTIDFADKFGANTRTVEESLARASGEKAKVLLLFVQGDFDGSISSLEISIEKMHAVSEAADRAMRRALLWVYISEWLIVSGTSMMCTFLLWTLMVKRRVYKEVEATRLHHTDN